MTMNQSTGSFQIGFVVPGSYTVRASQGEGSSRRRGETSIQVDSDLDGIVVPQSRAVTLKGNVSLPAGAGAPDPVSPNCDIRLLSAGAWFSAEDSFDASTDPTGNFEIQRILPGRYQLRMDCARGYVASAHLGDTDVLATGEVTITAGSEPPKLTAVLGFRRSHIGRHAIRRRGAGARLGASPACLRQRPSGQAGSPENEAHLLRCGARRLPSLCVDGFSCSV